MNPIYLLILSSLLLLQSPRSIQSISLSRLCGSFGHLCYGANWGKRGLPEYLPLNMKKNENKVQINENSLSNFKEIRPKLFRQRFRQTI